MAVERTLVIFGARGDLAWRLLLPGLGRLLTTTDLGDVQLIGTGRTPIDDDEWRGIIDGALKDAEVPDDRRQGILQHARFIAADVSSADDLRTLLEACDTPPVLYLAVPPAAAADSVRGLLEAGIPEGATLVMEKPLGTDLETAREVNGVLKDVSVSVHRVDHFLGEAAVHELARLAYEHPLFAPAWGNHAIEKIEILADEPLTVEGRASFYDGTGALVDMLQSHLLMVLAAITIDHSEQADAATLHAAKAELLSQARATSSRRGRYTAGDIDGREVPSYVDEEGVDPENGTETLAEMTVEIDTDRWRGVPFVLRSGKALAVDRHEIVVHFRGGLTLTTTIRDSAISLGIERTTDTDLDARVPDALTSPAPERVLTPYARLLKAVLDDDQRQSLSAEMTEQCWRIVEPVLESWRRGEVPLEDYEAGSTGW